MATQPAWVTFTKVVVVDLERVASFYKEVCGVVELVRVNSEIAGRPISEIIFQRADQGGMQFVLLKFLDLEEPRNDEVIVGITTDDVGALVERARRCGGEIISEPQHMAEHGVVVAFVKDPEGHLIEVIQHTQSGPESR